MSFWSKLGKGLAIGGAGLGTILTAGAASPAIAGALGMTAGGAAAGGAAATAGSSLIGKLMKGAQVGGPLASGIAGGMQKGRQDENTAAQQAANFKLAESGQNERNVEGRAGLDLQQRQFGQDSQNNAYANAIRSALAKNMQDVKVGSINGIKPVEISGGLRPSAMGPEGRAAADLMNQKAMMSLMNGEKFDALPALERTAPAEFKQPGLGENIMGGVGMGLNALNGAAATKQQGDFQSKIMAEIEKLMNPQGGAAAPVSQPQGAGVNPWGVVPQGKLLNPDDESDLSNR